MDLPQLPANLCRLMNPIIVCVHNGEETQGRSQSKAGFDGDSCVCLFSLSPNVWTEDGCSVLPLAEKGNFVNLALRGNACFCLFHFLSDNTISSLRKKPPNFSVLSETLITSIFFLLVVLCVTDSSLLLCSDANLPPRLIHSANPVFFVQWPDSLFSSPRPKRHQAE